MCQRYEMSDILGERGFLHVGISQKCDLEN